MVSGKYSALAGAISREQAIANISDNLANVSTTGFKRSTMSFESILRGEQQKTDAKGINYSRVGKNATDFAAGPLKDTGNPLDIAIHGDGFLKVEGKNGVAYTRRGDLLIGSDDILRTRSGMKVLDDANGEIIIPDSSTSKVSINNAGMITLVGTDGTGSIVGRLAVVNVDDPTKLKKEEDTTFSLEDGGQEIPIEEPYIVSGSLESSNVNMIEEMTRMIGSYRTFETLHKVLSSYSDISQKQSELGSLG